MIYTARSLEDIAQFFDQRGKQATNLLSNGNLTQKEKAILKREVYCWNEAARFLREVQMERVNDE